jgi:hypothetical protein
MGSPFQHLWADAFLLADRDSARELFHAHLQACLAIVAAISIFTIAAMLVA